jgi:hypothetical protein
VRKPALALWLLASVLAHVPISAQPRQRPAEAVIIHNDEPCPAAAGEEIVVCSREPLSAEARRVLHDVARCMARRWPDDARRTVLGLADGEGGYQQVLRRFLSRHPGCTPPGRLSLGGILLTGAIAEALLAADRGALAVRVAYRPERSPVRARGEAEVMSICAVRAEPDRVAALFGSNPQSAAETAILGALAPRLSACLAAGATGRFNRPAVRALLAIAAYRLSEHNRGAWLGRASD